jgi:hypothetical protein
MATIPCAVAEEFLLSSIILFFEHPVIKVVTIKKTC